MLNRVKDQRGETIIEVLITLTVLAVVLGASYASASKSLKASQTSQERTEAQYIAQSLIETVKILAQRDSAHVRPLTTEDLCFKATIADITADTAPQPNDPVDPEYEEFCTQGFYRKHVIITPLPPTPQGLQQYEYSAIVDWDSLATGQNQAILRYKHVRVPPTP